MNLFSLLDQAARRFPRAGAVYHGERLVHDFAGLRRRALDVANGLRRAGLVGQRVAILSENQPVCVELLFGIWAAEATAVPINAKLHPREVLAIVQDCEARLVLVSQALADGLQSLADWPGTARRVVLGSEECEALFAPAAPEPAGLPPATPPDALAWLFYTSGTTGRSKGAMLSHRNLLAMTVAHLADIEAIDEHHSQVHAAPMSHGSGLYLLPSIARGARQVIPASGGFDPAEFVELCSHHPGCGAFLAPTMVQRLRLEAERSNRRPTRLRSIVYGGGPMYVEELRKAMAVFGPVFRQIYGQGESPMTITGLGLADHASGDPALLGSVGCARSGVEVAVVDAEDRPLPPGEVGEVVCRGDVTMLGYWRNPAATAEALRGGWLHTGDLGSLDERGFLTLRDRSKDLVISGGSNVYPREVEEVLLTHPGVAEVCVVGRADPEWGEVVVAVVVKADPGLDAAALDAHCLAHIARFKRPRDYVFREALPKNAYGKVLKRELREQVNTAANAPLPRT
jgi:acyl-CoA synthetase (AMP-forming)/AMP-acid ligase II